MDYRLLNYGAQQLPAQPPAAPPYVPPAPEPIVAPVPDVYTPMPTPTRGARGQKASFKQLDRNHDGVLAGQEIARVVTPHPAAFDADRDGRVTRGEFLHGRKADAPKLPRLGQRSHNLYDVADKDDDGVLRTGETKAYRAYDRNHDHRVSQGEFATGQRRDQQAARDQLWLDGHLGHATGQRLREDAHGRKRKLPKQHLIADAGRIAGLLNTNKANVKRALPGILSGLRRGGDLDRATMVATLATVRTEVGDFAPINEYGGPGYWAQYNGRSDLGNRPGTNDGVRYHGRGYVQLTGRHNYAKFAGAAGTDILTHPERALRPTVAGKLLVAYERNAGVPERARRGDWLGVRKAVNGGTNGWDTFIWAVQRLQGSRSWLRKGY
ncbi:MAG: hypothetical protein JWM80_1623 [Cyanobacteria bacterium RYN_339]|nr:hypothetical protein [Cyanobacteria bacterium RYN_339]